MRYHLMLLALIMVPTAEAQFTVAPFGSSQVATPPIGASKKSPCANGGCELEINLRPYCFGTNLRAYNETNQLRPNGDISMTMKLSNSKTASRKDNIQIVFPGKLTFASEGVRMDCEFRPEQEMDKPGHKDIDCVIPWMDNKSFHYKVSGWKSSSNRGGGSDWTRYAARPLEANLIGTGNIDKNITCLYKFSSNNPKASHVLNTKVSCYFPSQMPNYSNLVKVFKDGKEIKTAEVFATTNQIKVQLQEPLKSVETKVPVRHGRVQPVEPPRSTLSYIQDGTRTLTAVREQENFDKTNANKSFSTVVKFPGSQGFCGGFYSPLMLFFEKDYPEFKGVSFFPLYGNPEGARVNWPEENAPGYFLAHLQGEESITKNSQLFGQSETFNNGFEALQIHDLNGDGVIDSKDPIFKELVLWKDKDSDGVSQKSEIISLSEKHVKEIRLNYSTRTPSSFGNRARAREKAKFVFEKEGKLTEADIFDVWLAPIDEEVFGL